MPRSQASLPLFPASSPAAEIPLPVPVRRRQLWMALDCDRLPLEIFAAAADAQPVAVVEGDGSGRRICRSNSAAAHQGVTPGLPLNAALALSPQLQVVERDPRREARRLRRLAQWAMRYTDLVSLEMPHRLLLEIQGSLKLFGGLDRLCQQICTGLTALGYSLRHAVAPTPRAALWLARGADGARVTDVAALPGALAELPLRCTGWSERALNMLEGMGVQSLGECLRLPRDGFARRLGVRCLADLDRALGRVAEPRRGVRPPARYRGSLELPAETFDRAMMGQGMRRLLDELSAFLRHRQAGVQQPEFVFRHNDGHNTRFPLGLAEPSADAGFLSELLMPRLEQARLHAPVVSLALRSGPVLPLPGSLLALGLEDGAGPRRAEAACRLLDRLRARLGTGAVRGICLLPEHRPEAAWDYVEPGTRGTEAGDRARPLWILETPRPLQMKHRQPWLEGPLTLRHGPERIETGWWDGKDVSRDYYEASSPGGMGLWIFRERRKPRRWFLHGVFG